MKDGAELVAMSVAQTIPYHPVAVVTLATTEPETRSGTCNYSWKKRRNPVPLTEHAPQHQPSQYPEAETEEQVE